MTHWAMVIDLRKCIGCKACTKVCKQTNKLPPDRWRRVIDCGVSGPPERQRTCLPVSCMHCDEPPCLEVCPTGATYSRPDGIVDVACERCIGCGYCIVVCPYSARTIIYRNESVFVAEDASYETSTISLNHDHTGVATKCNFCLPRLDAGLAEGLRPGVDPEATPACVIACSANALHFGDLYDPESVVSTLIRENKAVRLQEEMGTGPSVYYIAE